MVHIRDEGWKELKVGCVFAVQLRPTRDNHTGETVDLAHAVANTYVAHLGGPLSSAKPCGPRRDNATGCKPARRWCWAMGPLDLELGGGQVLYQSPSRGLVSRQTASHAGRHRLHGEGTAAARRGCATTKLRCCKATPNGSATTRPTREEVPGESERPASRSRLLSRQLSPDAISGNARRGFPIGSGMVESACKQFRARCRPGCAGHGRA